MNARPLATLALVGMTSLCGAGCKPGSMRVVDTVAIVDTLVRVDTVYRVDTVFPEPGLGLAPEPAPVVAPSSPAVGAPVSPAMASAAESDLNYLRSRKLLIPVAGVRPHQLPNTFDEARSGGARRHDAIDILAPRGTPVLSVDAGRVAKIDTSDRGGLSFYATDPSGRFMYYYAHLDRYRTGLREGTPLTRGDTVGYVGTTGNAPPNTPHLHFAINKLLDPKRWWDGEPINPWPLLANVR
jgi:murein DD-endopeptidase MepM/ murein hydrolase activator NlpD